jgi:hypothetical protein
MAPTIRLLLLKTRNLLDVSICNQLQIQESSPVEPVENKVQGMEYEVWFRAYRIGHQVLTELEKFVR